uniref:DUF3800 domain-containing protein n=1 Tax=Yoonia sp. TaxID=2212373 RepID=UPI00404876F9|tara:strand:- start:119 stop:913 length:795 start_codon:yes stop_codon:yes gene_type:complete
MKYTFYADESGQSGIKKIKSAISGGASRYMTMGAALVPNTRRDAIRASLAELAAEFGRTDLHCSKLNHNQIVRFAKVVAEQKVLLFGVISRKETLGQYKDDIGGDHAKYYNKCAQYLLERLGMFSSSNKLSEESLSICFEEGNFDYSGLRGLIAACRKNPLRPASHHLKHINPNSISVEPKAHEPLLQLGDLVAHALFRCVDDGPSSYGVFETRYVDELAPKFFADRDTGVICGNGIYPVHNLNGIKADKKVHKFLSDLKVNVE